jgi:hypothetical protein
MRRIVVFMALCLLSAQAAAAGTAFSAPYRLTLVKESAYDIAIGDLDGNRRQDLAVVSRNAPDWTYRLDLHLQRADGGWTRTPPVPLPEKFLNEYRVALADLDGDGRAEVVVGRTWEEGGLRVVDVGADGSTTMTEHAGPAVHCLYVATGDIDRDGRQDVVCHDEQLSAAVYLGDGRGGFRASHAFRTTAGWYVLERDFKTVQLADVTGDGYPDLLVAAGHSHAFHVFTNNRLGAFYPSVAYRVPGRVGPTSVHAADLDGDGINEVVTAVPGNRPESEVLVYRLGASGYLWLSEQVAVYDSPTAVLAGPVGPDSRVAVMVAHYTLNTVSVLGEDGAGLQQQFRYDLPGFGSHIDYGNMRRQFGLAFGDVDGDGCNDLAAATWSGVQLLFGCETFSSAIPVSDFDGDGVSDLLWRNDREYEHFLWRWGQPDSCLRPCPFGIDVNFRAQAFGDFDGDGSSDVFWRHRGTGANELRIGAFYSRPITRVADMAWRVVGAGDFNGDDRSDLLWRHSRTGAASIWLSADSATQQPVTTVTDLRWAIVGIGDFDGDGRSDILWRHAVTGANATDAAWRVAGVGDFDGDGRSDIFWRHGRDGRNVIWQSASYARQQSVASVSTQWTLAAIGDYDGDGLSDVLWRNPASGANVIWLGARVDRQRAVPPVPPDWGWFLLSEASS